MKKLRPEHIIGLSYRYKKVIKEYHNAKAALYALIAQKKLLQRMAKLYFYLILQTFIELEKTIENIRVKAADALSIRRELSDVMNSYLKMSIYWSKLHLANVSLIQEIKELDRPELLEEAKEIVKDVYNTLRGPVE